MEQGTEEKKDYEISFLLKSEERVDEILKALKHIGGEITLEGPIEKIVLAYKIKKETSASFGHFHFRALPADIKTLTQELKNNPEVLRTLVVTPPFVKSKRTTMRPLPKAAAPAPEYKAPIAVAPAPLSNEALEKKIEEILRE